MLRLLLIFIFTFLIFNTKADDKERIIENLNNTFNLIFEFEQDINGKIERGNCIIQYPKKMNCVYEKNQKTIVSNGKSLVIKTISSYYQYPLKKTPLNMILDKKYLINKIYSLKENVIDNSYINFTITENENEIDIFFDVLSLELIGWKTKDIYQNTAITLLTSVSKNQNIKKGLFDLPSPD